MISTYNYSFSPIYSIAKFGFKSIAVNKNMSGATFPATKRMKIGQDNEVMFRSLSDERRSNG